MSADALFASLATTFGVPVGTVKVTLLLFAAYPFSLVHVAIGHQRAHVLHLLSVLVCAWCISIFFPLSTMLKFIGLALISYTLTHTLGAYAWMPLLVFLINMVYLFYSHVQSMFANDSVRFDDTVPMMVLVIKLTSYAWSVYDGTKKAESLLAEQRHLAIVSPPGLLEFFGYLFFQPSFLVGPAFPFRDFQRFMRREHPWDKMPSPSIPALKTMAIGLFYTVFYAAANPYFSFHTCLTPAFQSRPLISKLLFFVVAGFVARTKFYAAWKVSEGACILTGLGYAGTDPTTKKPRWDGVENVRILDFEFATSSKLALDNWNINTAKWLRYCVYTRVVEMRGAVGLATWTTFLVSAFWHGWYAGYYLFFGALSFSTAAARTVRRHVRPLFVSPSRLAPYKPMYDILTWAANQLVLAYFSVAFMLLTVENTLIVWRDTYFIGFIGTLIVIVGFQFLGWKSLCRTMVTRMGGEPETRSVKVD